MCVFFFLTEWTVDMTVIELNEVIKAILWYYCEVRLSWLPGMSLCGVHNLWLMVLSVVNVRFADILRGQLTPPSVGWLEVKNPHTSFLEKKALEDKLNLV